MDRDRDQDTLDQGSSYPPLPLPPLPSSTSAYAFQPSAPPSAPLPAPTSWHAASFNPSGPDLQPDRLLTEPSAPVFYPDPDQFATESVSYPHYALSPSSPSSPSTSRHYRSEKDQYQDQYQDQDRVVYPQLRSVQLDLSNNHLIPNSQLQEVYQNDFLRNLPRRLSKIEHSSEAALSSTGPHGAEMQDFVAKMRSFETAYEAVQQCRLALFNLERKAKGYASKLWTVQSKSEVAKATCGDGATMSHTYTYQYGHHEPEVAVKLQKSLNRLFKQRTKYLIRMQFEETSCKLWIQDHLSSYLSTIKNREHYSESDLGRITNYLDILFSFERSARRQPDFDSLAEEHALARIKSPDPSTPENDDEAALEEDEAGRPTNAIFQSIHDWIVLMAAPLLHRGSFKEAEYLVIQVLRSRRVSTWGIQLIQCSIPAKWSSAYQEYYLTVLQLVLCGASLPKARLADVPESGHGTGPSLELCSGLGEADYLAILDQMDIAPFLNQLLLEHKDMHSHISTLFQTNVSKQKMFRLFAATRHLFDVLFNGLERLTTFGVASRRLAQLICQLTRILGDHLLVLGPLSSDIRQNTCNSSASPSATIQSELDHILQQVLRAILELPGHGLWTFLPSLPLKSLSTERVALFVEEIALDKIQDRLDDPASLFAMDPENNRLRYMLSKSPDESVFLVTALANMATTRDFSSTMLSSDDRSFSLEERVAMVITFLILDVAYLDKDTRDELSKPAREIISSMCEVHPPLISFVLGFVQRHFRDIGSVAQYLFRELPLTGWRMTRTDINILTQLLETTPLNSVESLFARSVFSSIPWSKAAMEDLGVSRVHKVAMDHYRVELALTMAEICSKYTKSTNIPHAEETTDSLLQSNPTPTSSSPATSPPSSASRTKSFDQKSTQVLAPSSFASNLPYAITHIAANSGLQLLSAPALSIMKEFMDWCWTMVVELELTTVEPLSRVASSRLHVQDPGLAKNHYLGQQTFVNVVHMLLTETCRHSEKFLKDGWTVLSSVLQTGTGLAFLKLAATLIPPVMATPKDEMAHHTAKFGALLREIAGNKQDPMLSAAGAKLAEEQELDISKILKESVAFWVLLHRHIDLRNGSTAFQANAATKPASSTSTKAVSSSLSKETLQFWMSAIFSQKDWMAHQESVQVMDVICHFCFNLGLDSFIQDALTEQQILLSIEFRRAPGMSAELIGLAQPGLDKVMDMLPERFSRALPVPQGSNDPSLLMGTWTMRTFATHLLTQQAMVESSFIWFAYYALLVETSLEKDMRLKIGHYYHQHPPPAPSSSSKSGGTSKATTGNLNIKTVMKTLGITNRKTLHNFAIWRWAQHLLILPMDTILLPLYWQMFFYLYFGHGEQRDIFYGYKFLEDQPDLVEQLKEQLLKTYTFFGQEARKALQKAELGRAEQLTTLHEFYIALYYWIGEPVLLTSEIDLKRIRKDLQLERLVSCRLPDPMECSPDLWRDLLMLDPPSSPSAAMDTPLSSPRKSSHSQDQSRAAARKHGQAWHERKISHSLDRLAKPAPDIVVPRALLPPVTIDNYSTASAQGLFGPTVRSIQGYGKGYHDICTAHQNLDDFYLKDLGTLYHNEIKTSKLEVACDTTPNALCKSPAVIELRYEAIVLNEGVRDSILENRERARALRLGHAEQGLCLAALEVTKLAEALFKWVEAEKNGSIGGGRREQDSGVNRTAERLAIDSFYFLVQELMEGAKIYPPVHILLTSLVRTLGMEVVAKDPAQTEPILDRMQADDFAISLLVGTFYPAAAKPTSEFVRLYERIATNKEYSLTSKDRLLRQFDVQTWALDSEHSSQPPTVQDRLSFYRAAFTAMVAQQQLQRQDDQIQESTELSTRDRLAIIKSHRELAGTLFLNFLQQDYIEYLRILLDTCAIMCLEPEVLEDFIRILGVEPRYVPVLLDGADVSAGMSVEAGSGPGAANDGGGGVDLGGRTTRISLSDYDFDCLVQFLSRYFRDCQERMNRGNLLDRYSGYAVSIASLLTVILCDERYFSKWMDPSSLPGQGFDYGKGFPYTSNTNQTTSSTRTSEKLWRDIQSLFRPWLSCLTDRASDETRFQRQQGGASRLLFVFVGLVSKMIVAVEHHHYYGTAAEDSGEHPSSFLVGKVFDFYLDLISESAQLRPQGGSSSNINQLMLLHQQFHRLPWKGLRLSREAVDRIVEVQSTVSSIEVRTEFWTYMILVVMEKAGSDLRPWSHQKPIPRGQALGFEQQFEQAEDAKEMRVVEAAFLRLGLTALQDVDRVVGDDSDLRQQFLSRLWTTVFEAGAPWDWLSTEDIQFFADSLTLQWERTGYWDDVASSMGLTLYWMRVAVGLERSISSEEEDKYPSSQIAAGGTASSNCGPDPKRVLIYFGYVLQLLQTRLSSSAQDSLNKNFCLDAIPSVVVHLGLVLDRVSGDPTETRHPVIYSALQMLIGTLNKCGGNPTGSGMQLTLSGAITGQTTFSHQQPFTKVLQGLQQMISNLQVIQLDLIRAVSQKLNSVPVMVLLLEAAIEREFELWGVEHQPRSMALSMTGSVNLGGSFSGGGALSGSVFGLEETTLQSMSPIPQLGHMMRTFQSHQNPSSLDDLQQRPQHQEQIYARNSWKRIQSQLETPELSEDEFIEEGQRMGAVLTLYGRYLQLLEGPSSPSLGGIGDDDDGVDMEDIHQTFDEILELGQELAEVISKVDLFAPEDASDEEVHKKKAKGYQALLLVRMFLTLVAKESVHSVVQSRFLGSVMQVCRTLELWCQDTRDWSKKGVLSSLGIGTHRVRTLDPRFRLVTRIIYTYMVVRLGDKGISIHQTAAGRGTNGGGGGVLAWRKGRSPSTDGSSKPGDPTSSSNRGGSGKDANLALIETLAQLPTKNKEYAAIFVKSNATSTSAASSSTALVPAAGILTGRSSPGVVTAAAATVASAAMAIPVRLIASSVSLSSSLSMSPLPPPTSSAIPTSSSPTAMASSPPLRTWSSSVPVLNGFGSPRHSTSNVNNRGKRLSMQGPHSRFSISSWDEGSGAIFALDEERQEPHGGHGRQGSSSSLGSIGHGFNPLLPPLPPSSAWRRERHRSRTVSLSQQQQPGSHLEGTKNGLADLEWAVEQIRDRRFRILEAVEILTEVLDRFYERDPFLA
ncbi:ectopic P granules protein 5 [Entomortierella parvispora]|uniref:Ectopic P granules protein 5 n=1 Tax=Entomortierella parvispora TaxID=205924 RepID=A0A9P3LVD4_9FUNG|nr:ectopic P granules protein 5 [Entomortierella parvispora]